MQRRSGPGFAIAGQRRPRGVRVGAEMQVDGRVSAVSYREPAAALYAGPMPTRFVAGS